MDNLIQENNFITMEAWNQGYKIVESRHKWVESQPFAREAYTSGLFGINVDAGNTSSKDGCASSNNSYANSADSYTNSNFIRKNEIIKEFSGNISKYPPYISSHFIISAYACPICGQPLYKTLFHNRKLIDTKEGGKYIERIFTCNKCMSFFAADRYGSRCYYELRLSPERYQSFLDHYNGRSPAL
ncbi:MAG TPA: hypothetical protein GXX49_01080 [Clostridiaceae bacterium]|nr:hypothetical protein [Clostridiaceae bacterium]